ncbi:MAG: MFS transporter [Phycisphaerae bacterium]|nr:MFS transporter [Phycisphaerae bacterium]
MSRADPNSVSPGIAGRAEPAPPYGDRGGAPLPRATPESPPPPSFEPPRSAVSVLRHRDFRIVWIASFGSSIGNWMEMIAVQWIVAEQTGDVTWMGYLAAAQLAPSLVLGMFGGVVADHVNRRSLLLVSQFIMMIVALGFVTAAALHVTTPRVLLFLCLAQGLVLPFNAPAWQVLTPRLVPRGELTNAIVMQGIQFNMARVIGPSIGGILLAWGGPTVLFAINALSFIGVLAGVIATPDAPAPPPKPGDEHWLSFRSVWNLTRDAMVWVFTRPGPRAAMLATFIFALLATPILRFLPLFVSQVYEMNEETYGGIVAVMGVGAVLGGILIGKFPAWYPKHHFIPMSVLGGGLSILAFALTTNVIVAAVIMVFVGLFWMWAFNSAMSATHMLVSDEMRGRVLAVSNTIAMGLMPAGSLLAGWIGEGAYALLRHYRPRWESHGFPAQAGIAGVAILLLAAGAVMLTFRTPEVDGLHPGDPGYDRRPGLFRGLLATAHRPR